MTDDELRGALVVDVETCSELQLPRVGIYRYANHPSTRLLVATFGLVAEETEPTVWLPDDELPIWIIGHLMCGKVIAAWNAQFDVSILNRFLPANAPRIMAHQVHDIAAQAASAAMPRSVEKCFEAMGLGVAKDPEGLAAMHFFKLPRKWVDGEPVWGDDPTRFAHLVRYCQKDTANERTLMRHLPRLQELDRPVCDLDMKICARGLKIDRRLITIGGPALMQAMADADAQLRALTDGAIRGVTKRNDFIAFLEAHGVELVKPEEKQPDVLEEHGDLLETAALDPEEIASIDSNGEEVEEAKPSTRGALTKDALAIYLAREGLPDVVRQALELRREYGRTSTAKLKSLAGTLSADDRTRDYLSYHAASTGRAGGRLLQPQNLPRDSVTPEAWLPMLEDIDTLSPDAFREKHSIGIVTALVRMIRGAIIPAHGHVLAGGDFSKIELMIGAWLSGADKLLKELAAGTDTYRTMAAAIYNIHVDEVTSRQRQVGKSAMLGCIFGLGAVAFKAYVFASTRIEIDEATAQRTIDLFRQTYFQFPEAWREVGNAALRAAAYPGTVQPCLGNRVIWTCTPRRDWLTATLPSARRLRYRKPSYQDEINRFGNEQVVLRCWGVNSRNHQWQNDPRHGSLLFQNCVQAVARDLLMAAVQRLEAAELPVVLHVHDEVLCEVPVGKQPVTVAEIHRIMTARPSWANDIPVDAECWIGDRYGKVDKETVKEKVV